MPSAESVSDGLGRWPRFVVLLLGAALIAHGVLVGLWLAPSSPVRNVVGGSFLASYIDPYFKQGNDTLGIGSNRIDESLQIRAWVKKTPNSKKSKKTEWLDVTALETRRLRGDFAAARSHQAARRIAASLNLAMLQFNPEQLKVVAEFGADSDRESMRRELLGAGAKPLYVLNFLGADEMARRYASLWLGAEITDGEIVKVAYRVGRRQAPSVKDGSAATLKGRPFTWFDMGNRKPYRGTPEARAAFKDYVKARRHG